MTNPADIERHKRFKKMVDDLMKYSYIRHYTADIRRRTGESTGNITNYYKGRKPISDNFIARFEEAYAAELKLVRKKIKGDDRPVASDKPTQQSQTDPSKTSPDTRSSEPTISEPAQVNTISEARFIKMEEAIEKLTAAVAILTQKIDAQSKPPRKKK